MNRHTAREHMIDFVFSISLFFVFAASALTVVLISSNAYQSIARQTEANFSSRTSLSYIAQKARQNDAGGSIHAGTLQGHDALIISQTLSNSSYSTYIYEYDGRLMELFAKDGSPVSVGQGTAIMSIKEFSLKEISTQLFQIKITDMNGKYTDQLIGLKSSSD